MFCSLKATQPTRLKAEFQPLGASAATDVYVVDCLDEANRRMLENPAVDPQAVQKITSLNATGPQSISELPLSPGTYYIIANNPGKTPLKLAYSFYELGKN